MSSIPNNTKFLQKKARKSDDQVMYKAKQSFVMQEQAKKNYDVQKFAPPKLKQQSIISEEEDEESYRDFNEDMEQTEHYQHEIIDSIGQNIGKKEIQQNVQKPQQKKKISLQMQEKILNQQIMEMEMSSQKRLQEEKFQTEQKDQYLSQKSLKSTTVKETKNTVSQSTIKRTQGTNDYSSKASKPASTHAQSNIKGSNKDNKNPLIQHLQAINIRSTTQSSLRAQDQSLNKKSNSYFSQTRDKYGNKILEKPDNKQQGKIKKGTVKKDEKVESSNYLDDEADKIQKLAQSKNIYPSKAIDQQDQVQKIRNVDLLDFDEQEENKNLSKQQVFQKESQNNEFNLMDQMDFFNTNQIQQQQVPTQFSEHFQLDFLQNSAQASNKADFMRIEIGDLKKQEFQEEENKKIVNERVTLADRSRKRTEKNKKKKKQKYDKNIVERRQDMEQLPEQQRMRSMKDIQNDSLRTSYALTKRSFKWSIRAKNMLSSGRPSFKRVESKFEEQFDTEDDDNKKIIKQQKDVNSSEESMDLEEDVGDLEQRQPRESNIGLVSQKITEQKGYKFKQRQIEKEEKNNILSQQDGWKALESFYSLLSKNQNHSDIISSVEIFGEAMTLFIENQQKFTHVIQNHSFIYHSNVGQGSFGQVDLYFFKQSLINKDSAISDSQYSQKTWNSMNSTIRDSQQSEKNYNLIFSMNQSNDPTPQNFLYNKTSSKNNLLFSSEYQQQNMVNKLQNQNQIGQQNNSIIGSQVKQQSLYIDRQQSLTYNEKQMTQQTLNKLLEMQYLPVACKKIEILEEFMRELFIMQTIKCEYMPKLIFKDMDKQLLFMELGLCSLEDLKLDSEDDFTFSDEFTYQILVNILKAVEALLSNVNPETNEPQPIFHSDIKPSNIMLTVKKYKNQQNCSIKLLLIDYGGSSFALEDYWSFYTPAFVSAVLWQKLVNNIQNNEYLTWPEVRYAEVYAACRSVQYMIVPEQEKELFKRENYQLFLNTYSHLYPKTCFILKQVFYKESIGQIHDIYRDGILSSSEKTLYTGMNPQNIPFESKKIFELSKFYNCQNENKEQPNDQMEIDKEDNF